MNPVTDDVRTEALFVSDLQRSQQPTAEVIRSAVRTMVDRWGATGCAERVAQEFGDYPDVAIGRMLWARTAIQLAFP